MIRRTVLSFLAGVASMAAIGVVAGIPGGAPRGVHERASNAQKPAREEPPPVTDPSPSSRGAPVDPASAAGETFRYDPIDREHEPIEPIPTDVELFFEDYLELDYDPDRIELGRRLFHDVRLSRDDSLSCASCHDLRYAGIDRAITATGFNGQIGALNTPTVYNAVLGIAQFWDGRAPDLETQADGPPTTPSEMASSWNQILSKLAADESMLQQFQKAFPDVDFSAGIPPDLPVVAIADFERTLITPDSPFDRYLRGDDAAVSERVKEGYQIFKDVGCVECHYGLAVGNASYQRLGRTREYEFPSMDDIHLGRFNVTGLEADRHAFKVGGLRNVALTAPYLHDGSVTTLDEAIRIMGEHQLGLALSDGQVERIGAFLTSLTGTVDGRRLDEIQNTIDHRDGGRAR